MQSKRGDISTSTIVYVILGIAALVVLVIALTGGFGKLAPWLSKDNVDSIVTQCSVACSTLSQFDFCTKTMELKDEGNTFVGTCNDFATNKNYAFYGIFECPPLEDSCPSSLDVSGESPLIMTN